jgi:uncharacterized protein YjbJ (UPF0337 family)
MADNAGEAGIKGVVEDIKGKVKEVAGNVTDDDDLRREGEAQQDKARDEREVAEHEAKADAARAKAQTDEARQKSHQDS